MADDYFDTTIALNPRGGTVANAVATVYAIEDTTFSTPLEIAEMSGQIIDSLVASPEGVYPQFRVTSGEQRVNAKSGEFITAISSVEGMRGPAGADGEPGPGVDTAGSNPGEVLTSNGPGADPEWRPPAANGGIQGAPAVWPSVFAPSTHSHGSGQISDATTVGRQVMTAADAQAARAAIGAGTGNGTSNLTLGSAATQAAPGSHSHPATAIPFTPTGAVTAANVQDAIVQAATMGSGGGGGASQVQVLKFSAGQYPAFPATKPAGIIMFTLIGPVTPTASNVSGGIPAYVGNGSTQIPAEFRVNAGLT